MRTTVLLPLICIFLMPLYATVPEGSALSLMLENNLTQKGFICARESLAITAQDTFPFNVAISFLASPNESMPHIAADAALDNKRSIVIFDFLQEDAYAYFDAIVAFLQQLKETPLICDVLVLFAAQEQSPFSRSLSGTDVFTQNFDESDRACAITIRFLPEKPTAILTGNSGNMTPLWLTKQLITAFSREEVSYTFPHRFSALYRPGFLRGDWRMASFIRNGIPAAAVQFHTTSDLRALHHFAEQFTPDGTEFWDNHYIFFTIPRPFISIWIGEQFFFLVCLILGTLFLLILCSFSFVGKNGADYKKDFTRSWYLIPLTIGITFFSFLLGQHVCASLPFLVRATPVAQFGIKLIFALAFISVLFAIQEYVKISSIQFTHGYFIYLMGIGNIFVFSAIDISFFAVFLLEYALIYIARKANRMLPLIISVLLMLIPFAPYVYYLLRDGYYADLEQLVFSPPLYNLLLAMLVFPFLIMWLRMLVRLEIFAATNNFSFKKMLLQGSLSTGSIIIVTILFIVGLSLFSRRTMARTLENTVQTVNENRYTFEITATKDSFQGMTTRHMHILSKEAAVHYDVTLSSEGSVPLYDSTYDYTVNEETQSATFIVPDYPPQAMTIDYAANTSDVATFFVTAWYKTAQADVFRKESHAFVITGAE